MLRALPDGAGAVHALGHVAKRLHGLIQRAAFGQQQADLAVAAQVARGGQHQVAQARQAGEGLWPRAQRHAQAGDFGQAARDEGRARVQAQVQAIGQAGGDGQHVFDGAAHFHAHQVVVAIHAHRGAVQRFNHGAAHVGVAAGGHQGGGLAAGHFLRKAGAAQGTGTQGGRHLPLHFVRHQAEGARGAGVAHRLEALAQPRDGHVGALQQFKRGAQPGNGRGDDDQVGLRHGGQQAVVGRAAAQVQFAR